MDSCIFCKIANHEIPANIVWEDEQCLAFHDLTPQAPVHVLIIPKHHLASIAEASSDDKAVLAHITCEVIPKLAKQLELAKGFRTVINTGVDGGQTVHHLHFHLLGGRSMQWPPG